MIKTLYKEIIDWKYSYELIYDDVMYRSLTGQLMSFQLGNLNLPFGGGLYSVSDEKNDKRIIFNGEDKSAIIYDYEEQEIIRTLSDYGYFHGICKEKYVVFAEVVNEFVISVIDIESGKIIWKVDAEKIIEGVSVLKIMDNCIIISNFLNNAKEGASFIAARLEIETGKVIWRNEKEFKNFRKTKDFSCSVFLLIAKEGMLFLAVQSKYDSNSPPSQVISLDISSGKIISNYTGQSFGEIDYQTPRELGRLSTNGFYPLAFKWDDKEKVLLQLCSSGIYLMDFIKGKSEFKYLKKKLIDNTLCPSTSASLYGDNFFFSSSWPMKENIKAGQWSTVGEFYRWSLGAINIRSLEIDWIYDFPPGYILNSLNSPKANHKFIVTNDSEKRLHVFERLNT